MEVRQFRFASEKYPTNRKIYIYLNDKLLQADPRKSIMKKPTLTCIILVAAILMLFLPPAKKIPLNR
jgi:hypothetical protein